jgi:transcriptional regulator with XRE-family HTH domain
MEERGYEPTYRRLAREAGLGVETVRQAIIGRERRPSPETARRLAVALQKSARTIDKSWGYSTSTLEPYEAPKASARLTPKQRKALDALILSMVEPEERRRPTEDEKRADRELGEAGNRFVHGDPHTTQAGHALAADSNSEQGRKDRGAPPEA